MLKEFLKHIAYLEDEEGCTVIAEEIYNLAQLVGVVDVEDLAEAVWKSLIQKEI